MCPTSHILKKFLYTICRTTSGTRSMYSLPNTSTYQGRIKISNESTQQKQSNTSTTDLHSQLAKTNQANHFTHPSGQMPKPKPPPLNPASPNKEINQRPITNAKRNINAEIAPLMAILNIQGSQIIVASSKRTILTTLGGIRIHKIPRSLRQPIRRISRASSSAGDIENRRLSTRALDLLTMKRRSQHTADKIRRGIEIVDPPFPENHVCIRHHNAVEQRTNDKQERKYVCDDSETRGPGRDPLAPRRGENVV